MDRTFTQEDLILFIYNEMSSADRAVLIHELTERPELREELVQLADTLEMISDVEFEPSATSVAIIIEDSLSSHLELS